MQEPSMSETAHALEAHRASIGLRDKWIATSDLSVRYGSEGIGFHGTCERGSLAGF